MGILIYILFILSYCLAVALYHTRKKMKVFEHNYITAIKVLRGFDPSLDEYLERESIYERDKRS